MPKAGAGLIGRGQQMTSFSSRSQRQPIPSFRMRSFSSNSIAPMKIAMRSGLSFSNVPPTASLWHRLMPQTNQTNPELSLERPPSGGFLSRFFNVHLSAIDFMLNAWLRLVGKRSSPSKFWKKSCSEKTQLPPFSPLRGALHVPVSSLWKPSPSLAFVLFPRQ